MTDAELLTALTDTTTILCGDWPAWIRRAVIEARREINEELGRRTISKMETVESLSSDGQSDT